MIARIEAQQGQGWGGPLVQGAALVQVHAEKSLRVNVLDKVDRWTGWTALFRRRRAHLRTYAPARARAGVRSRARVVLVHFIERGEKE